MIFPDYLFSLIIQAIHYRPYNRHLEEKIKFHIYQNVENGYRNKCDQR